MKKFKMHNRHIELSFDVAKEENFNMFASLLNLFELSIQTTICTCSYGKDLIDVGVNNGEINVEVNANKKKFLRVIHLKDTEVTLNSLNTLKKMLQISRDYDAILTIKSANEADMKAIVVVNDNGNDYINFNENKYNAKEIKAKIIQILNQNN